MQTLQQKVRQLRDAVRRAKELEIELRQSLIEAHDNRRSLEGILRDRDATIASLRKDLTIAHAQADAETVVTDHWRKSWVNLISGAPHTASKREISRPGDL